MNYSALVRDFVTKAQEVEELLSDLLRDLLELKKNVPGEKSVDVTKAISTLSTSQQQLSNTRQSVEQILVTKESVNETPSDLIWTLLKHGYSRNVAAPQNEVWYAHPNGHQVRAQLMTGETGLCWEHFPPDLRTINRGFGMDRLREHLQLVHRGEESQADSAGEGEGELGEAAQDRRDSSQEARDAFQTPYRDFLIVQTDVEPVARYLVREAGQEYPHIIAHFPRTGEWRDYTVEASGYPEDDRYIEIVKRWHYEGRPAAPSGGSQ